MFPCLRHAVEHGQQLPHTGGESQFLRLPSRQEPLVELSNDWVSACRHQGSHGAMQQQRTAVSLVDIPKPLSDAIPPDSIARQ